MTTLQRRSKRASGSWEPTGRPSRRRSPALLLGALLLIGAASLAVAGCADDGEEAAPATQTSVPATVSAGSPNTITVTGDATVNAAPDEAVITLSVENDAPEPGTALDENSKSIQKVLDRLKAEGVPEADIQTSNVSLYPVRTYDPQTGKESLTGYRANNSVTVTLKDAALVGKILAASVETGATNVSGPVWRLTEDAAAVAEALKKAVANAQAKAQTLAEAQGVKVGPVVMIAEGAVEVPVVPMYTAMESAAGRDAAKVAEAPISAGTLEVTANVTVSYGLER